MSGTAGGAAGPASGAQDAGLVAAAQRGDADAFSELFRRYFASVHKACARRLGDRAEGEELAQAAFVRAYERLAQCAGDRRFAPWVHMIARNLCIDCLRSRARVHPRGEARAWDDQTAAGGPEESLLFSERAEQLRRALAALPPRQRQVVVARHLHERGPGEIAAALGLTVPAVDSLLLRARRRLATCT